MAFAYNPQGSSKTSSDGLDARPALRDAFWDLVEAYGATYFCGHQHVYHAEQPRLAQGGKAWQVIVGSGGSPFSVKADQVADAARDRVYAWAEVEVLRSGQVRVIVRGFDENMGPTKVLDQMLLP